MRNGAKQGAPRPWVAAPAGRLDTASVDGFHELAEEANAELSSLGSASRNVVGYSAELHRTRRVLLVALGAAVAVTALVARRLRLAAYRPLRQLESRLAQVGAAGLLERVEITGDREFHAVADALNEMSDRLQSTVGELEFQAFHDSLTGLPNRAMLERRLSAVLDDPTMGTVGLVMLDLDGFKAINDGLGHPAGDGVLIAVGQRLVSTLRPNDLIGRLGGDEFAVVVTNISANDIDAITDRLATAFAQPILAAGRSLILGATAGAALARPGETPADLFRHADIALYSAKDAGTARLHLFEQHMLDHAEQRLATETELRAGIATGQIEIHYQPTVSIRTGRVVGVEALARWNHPTRGLVAPGEFISLAEDTGLIVPLGRVVLIDACAQVAAWHDLPELEHLSLSVNVSALQLHSPTIIDDVRAALSTSGLVAGSLVLEVTESIAADARAVAILRELRTLGIRIALDDFGTGFSSLSCLQRLPIDILKIDKSFIDDIQTQADRAALAGAIIRLGHSFGMQIVAEGVEEPQQLSLLTQLDCDVAQGYLLARPAPARTALETLLALGGTVPPSTTPGPTATDNSVVVQIGPVTAVSATEWLTYAAVVLDRVRASPPEGFRIPPGVLAAIDTYVTIWAEVASRSTTFSWTGREDPAILQAITHHWFQLAELLTQESLVTAHYDAPPAGEPFYAALVSGLLVALAAGHDTERQAEAIILQRSWPTTPDEQINDSPVMV